MRVNSENKQLKSNQSNNFTLAFHSQVSRTTVGCAFVGAFLRPIASLAAINVFERNPFICRKYLSKIVTSSKREACGLDFAR